MFNTSRILRNTWTAYRTHARRLRLAKFDRSIFAEVLKGMRALEEDAVAKANADRASFDRLKSQPVAYVAPATRANEITAELLAMEYSDAPTNWTRHRQLNAELFRLSVQQVAH